MIGAGDVIGLFGEISGHRVSDVASSYQNDRYVIHEVLLDDGRWVGLSDIAVVRTDNEDGTATETFSDGRVVVIGEEEL